MHAYPVKFGEILQFFVEKTVKHNYIQSFYFDYYKKEKCQINPFIITTVSFSLCQMSLKL